MYSNWLLCKKLKYSEYSFSYTILHNELYQDPGKGNVIADSVITTPPITFIFTRYCLFSMLYRFMDTIENLFRKMYTKEGTLINLVILLNTKILLRGLRGPQ